jgi:hypothetical protein
MSFCRADKETTFDKSIGVFFLAADRTAAPPHFGKPELHSNLRQLWYLCVSLNNGIGRRVLLVAQMLPFLSKWE